MHLFLTGDSGVGKSAAIRRTLALLGVTPGGFLTYYGPGRAVLYLAGGWEEALPAAERRVAAVVGGRPRGDSAAFDRLGCAAIAGRPEAPLLLFDECGNLEREALAFRRAVLSALDGDRPILGVVKPQRAGTWLEDLAAHPRVTVISVTAENRDALPLRLAAELRPAIGTGFAGCGGVCPPAPGDPAGADAQLGHLFIEGAAVDA